MVRVEGGVMSWYVMGVPPYPFAFAEPPETIEVESDADESRIRYVPERTCKCVRKEAELPSELDGKLVKKVLYLCSECDMWLGKVAKYCPSCGAKVVE